VLYDYTAKASGFPVVK